MIDDKIQQTIQSWVYFTVYLIEMLFVNLMEMILFNLNASLHLRNEVGPSRDAQQNYQLIWTDLTFKYSVLP